MCRDRVLCFLLTDPPATIPPPQSSQATVTVSSLRIAMALWHPIFGDIDGGNLEEVQRRVRADAAVLEERAATVGNDTVAPRHSKAACHRPLADRAPGPARPGHWQQAGGTALHWASGRGLLPVVQALVGAGANPAALDPKEDATRLAACNNHATIVDFLLQQPAVKATIDTIDSDSYTALSLASCVATSPSCSSSSTRVPTPPSPLASTRPSTEATHQGHHDVAALLRTALAEPQRPRSLLKARALLDAALAVPEAGKSGRDKGVPIKASSSRRPSLQPPRTSRGGWRRAGSCLPSRWWWTTRHWAAEEEEELVACVKYALGLEGGADFATTAAAGSLPAAWFTMCSSSCARCWCRRGTGTTCETGDREREKGKGKWRWG